MSRRVVVTGIGAVTPVGIGKDAFWNSIINGISGVGPVTRFDASDLPTTIAAEVKGFEPEKYLDKKEIRRMDLFAQYAAAASLMAVEDAHLSLAGGLGDRAGVLIGSGIGGIRTLYEQIVVLREKGPRRISPFLIPMMIPDMASGQVSILLGARGYNSCTVTACASSANAVGDAFRVIARGDADLMITGGAEAGVELLPMAGFCAAKTLSTRNDEPARASRPFERDRDGFVLGEGAGIIVLEELEHALARGAEPYAEVVGYGVTGDAHHITAPAPGGEGAARAMRIALKDAGMEPKDIDYINAHGTATEYNDYYETQAIKSVFGADTTIPVSSTKSMTGHLLGAAGGIEAIATVLALKHQIIPPTINYENPDPQCDLDYVPNVARPKHLEAAMSNSFGFGGHNAVLVFRRFS